MGFYDFNIMADQPADPKVNVVTQLDNNWDLFDSRLSAVQLNTSINTIPLAQREVGMLIAGRLSGVNGLFYWDGANWIKPVDYTKAWTSWADVQLAVGRFHYPGTPLRWRRNSALRLVELSGGLLSSASTWPGSYTSIVAATGSGISNTFKPLGIDGGRSFGIVAAFAQVDPAPTSQYSTGACLVKGNGPNTEIDIQIKWTGQDTPPVGEGRGFFLDRMRWFY